MSIEVSILTRPTGRVQLDPVFAKTASIEVSILTRPTGRVQPGQRWGGVRQAILFQSSPGLRAGCNTQDQGNRRQLWTSFNPHPAYGPGATTGGSIQKRGGGRRFNPHPAYGPGATLLSEFPIGSSRTSLSMLYGGHCPGSLFNILSYESDMWANLPSGEAAATGSRYTTKGPV